MTPELPTAWTLAASAFNWTPDVIRAERAAPDIAVGIVADGIAPVIELEPGQLWRSFPASADAEVDALRRDLDARRRQREHRRGEPRRLARPGAATHRGRATGLPRFPSCTPRAAWARPAVRLPIGQAGEPLLRRLLPTLHELDLVLYEEIQGQQTPDSPTTARGDRGDRRT